MLPSKKIIAFDVDGTLTVSKTPITEEMASFIKKIIKQKIVVAISGGGFTQLQTQFLPPFLNDTDVLPFIKNLKLLPTSGSQRYEFDEEKKVWALTDKEPLDPKVKERAIKLLQGIIDSGLYEIPPHPIGNIIEDRDTQVTFTPNGQQAPVEMKKLFDPSRKKREKIVAAIGPQLPEVDLLINGVSSIDVLPKGFSKAVGLSRLLEKFCLEKTDMLFIGDALFPGGNDYSVKEAGIETIAVSGPEETEKVLKTWIS